MKFIFLSTFLTLSICSFSQSTKKDSIRILQEIVRNENSISMPGVGYGVVPSRQWYASAFLISLVTADELLEMTKDTNEGLRLSAFIGLIYSNYHDLPSIKKTLSGDTTTILSLEGCVIEWTTVGYAANHIERWNAVIPMKELLQKMSVDNDYREDLFDALIHKTKIKRYNQL